MEETTDTMTAPAAPHTVDHADILLQETSDINDLEMEILQQLDVISREADETFLTFVGVLGRIREISLTLSPENGAQIEKYTRIFTTVCNVGKDVYKAYQRNKALNHILTIKQEIASQKSERIGRVAALLKSMESRQLQMLAQEAGKTYNPDELLMNDSRRDLLYRNQDKMIAVCRRTVFSRLLADYLSACYAAWTEGQQSPRNFKRPCMMDVNNVLVEAILPLVDGKYLHNPDSNDDGRAHGGTLMALHDEGLAATALICNHTKDGEFSFDHYVTFGKTYFGLNDDRNKIIELEEEEDRYPSYSVTKRMNIAMCILVGILAIIYLPDTGMATWLKWVIGVIGTPIIGVLAGTSIGMAISVMFYKKADADYEQYVIGRYYDAAGYQDMEEPDMEKANLLQLGADSALTNLSGFEFTDEARRKYGITKDFERLAKLARIMDDYYIDPLLGLIPVVGDLIAMSLGFPFVYVSLVKARSFPLAACVVYNYAKDYLFGMVPGVGDVIDAFYKMNKRNARLITGYMNGDPETVQEVHRRAFSSVVFTIIFIALIVIIAIGIVELFKEL